MSAGNFNVEQIKANLDAINKKLVKYPQLEKLEKTVGVPVVYVFAGAIVLAIIFVYVCSGLRAITNLVAFVYPAYMSIKAINSSNKDDDTLWLAYWLWYGLFALVESITDVLLFWIPMYELLKMGFYIYLYAPNIHGALTLYDKLIKPLLPYLEQCEQKMKEVTNVVTSKTTEKTTPGAGTRKTE